ncbi:hypothetical protein [Oceanivirga salmonicida]|uniref:hypothetical protein n=1 Tax=Oceanivirga salmonicida TaxID=1769291 RepID=UPI0012E2BC44|nr:hypothetical protein [Oceanivirga salmonicida]
MLNWLKNKIKLIDYNSLILYLFILSLVPILLEHKYYDFSALDITIISLSIITLIENGYKSIEFNIMGTISGIILLFKF